MTQRSSGILLGRCFSGNGRRIIMDSMNLSFAGCGYLGIYHVGVASCFKQYAPQVLENKITGASVGALVASAFLCNVPLGISTSVVLRVSMKARSRALGPFHPGFDVMHNLYEGMASILPEDAHLHCNGKLHVSVTRVSDGANVLLNQFDSRDDLLQALMCSCFIPIYCGLVPPKFHGVGYMDGGFSDNQPILDDSTVTVAPFCGESDICPEDINFSIMQINLANTSISITPGNMYRFARILFPGHPEMLSKLCQNGFDDALRFLQTNNLIPCTRCLTVQSSIEVSDSEMMETDDTTSTDSEHDSEMDKAMDKNKPCRVRETETKLPEPMINALQEAVNKVNKGLINWLFKHRSVTFLSYLSLPGVLSVDITIMIITKIWRKLRKFQVSCKLKNIHLLMKQLIRRLMNHPSYSAKFSCQLALTEFDYTPQSRKSFRRPQEICNNRNCVDTNLSDDTKSRNNAKLLGVVTIPERVISNVKFDLTVDLPQRSPSQKPNRQEMLKVLKSVWNNRKEVSTAQVACKALNWKRERSEKYKDLNTSQDGFDKMLEVTTKQDALMAYYYLDEDMNVKVTEIFNISEEELTSVRNCATGRLSTAREALNKLEATNQEHHSFGEVVQNEFNEGEERQLKEIPDQLFLNKLESKAQEFLQSKKAVVQTLQ